MRSYRSKKRIGTHRLRAQAQPFQGEIVMGKEKATRRLDIVEILGSIQEMAFENEKVNEEIERLKKYCVNADKFHAKTMSVELVAYLHDVHPNTVRKYVNCGLIEKHPTSSQTRIKIRASDALMLDFATMKKKAKTLIYDQDETQSKSNF